MNNIYKRELVAWRGRHGCDHMVVGFTTTCADNAYHHYRCEFESHSWRSLLDTTLSDVTKVCKSNPENMIILNTIFIIPDVLKVPV
jgi:hypothetical protein